MHPEASYQEYLTADYKSSTYNGDVGVALAGKNDDLIIFVFEQFRKSMLKRNFELTVFLEEIPSRVVHLLKACAVCTEGCNSYMYGLKMFWFRISFT